MEREYRRTERERANAYAQGFRDGRAWPAAMAAQAVRHVFGVRMERELRRTERKAADGYAEGVRDGRAWSAVTAMCAVFWIAVAAQAWLLLGR